MECPVCTKNYQEDECEPYILIGCGHSICLDCLKEQSIKNEIRRESADSAGMRKFQIDCPECGVATQAESLNQFPKNFSLLNMIKSGMTSRTNGPGEKDHDGEGNTKSLIGQEQHDSQARHATMDDQRHYQSVSEYNSTVNYDRHRDDLLGNLDVHDQISHSQGGQGDQSGARDYKRSDLSKLDPSDASAARSSLNVREFDNESLSVKLNGQDEKKLVLSQQNSVEAAQHSQKKGARAKANEQEPSEASRSVKEEAQSMYECELHGKGIQGYCQTDRQVLCIDCILSGIHKNHEMCSIDKAARQERDALTVKFQKSQVLQDLVHSSLVKAKNHQEQLQNQTLEYKNKIQQIYQEVRALIDEKERSLLADVETKLQKEVKYLNNRDKDGQNQLKVISEFQSSWNKLGELTDEQLLVDINGSYKEAEKALCEPKPIKINQVIPRVNKDTEIAQLTKFLLNSANQVNLPLGSSTSNTIGNHVQATATPEAQSAKAKDLERDQANAPDLKQGPARKAAQRRDSNFKAPNFPKQATQRSSSTRPNTFIQGSEPSSSTTVASNLQKANYMQATSSWAKRKHENEKQKEEFHSKKTNERSKYQNPKGFTTTVGGQHAASVQGEQPIKGRDAVSNNIVRNSRLASKDRRITNPFDRQQAAEKQISSIQPLGSVGTNGGYNSTQKITGSPTNINQTGNDYNPLGKLNKSSKPESSEKKKKGRPALMPQLTNQGSSVLRRDANKHTTSQMTNNLMSKQGASITDPLPSQASIVGTQSLHSLSNTGGQFQSQNSKPALQGQTAGKGEKLHFLKSKPRQPILKESRGNNNSRLGMDPSEKEGPILNKSQISQRNRSQTRLEDKTDHLPEKASSGASTVPTAGPQGRKKQTWQRTNTMNNIYHFDQGSTDNCRSNPIKKGSNQSMDNDIASPLKNTAAAYKNSFQRAALEKKKHAETSLRSSQEDKFQSQQIPDSTSDDTKYLLNLNGSKPLPQMNSLADKRNEMKNRNNHQALDGLGDMAAVLTEPNMDAEIQQLHDQYQQQNDGTAASAGFNDTSYTRQIQQLSQNISLESKIEQIQKQLEARRLQQEPLCNTDRPTQAEHNAIQDGSGAYLNFNSSLQLDMAAVKAGPGGHEELSYRQLEGRLQSTQLVQSSSAVVSDPQVNAYGQIEGRFATDGAKESPGLGNERDSLEDRNNPLETSSPQPVLEAHGAHIAEDPKALLQATGGFQHATQEDQAPGPKQTRQRWQTMKKQRSNGEVAAQPRGASMSHVFVDDSQDNMNLNDLVPHNDTEYNYQPDEAQSARQATKHPLNDRDISHTPNQLITPQQASPHPAGERSLTTEGTAIRQELQDDGPASAIDQSTHSQYTEQQPTGDRKLDFYPQIQSFVQSKEEYEQIQSSRRVVGQPERDVGQGRPADQTQQPLARNRPLMEQNNYLMDGPLQGDLSSQLQQVNEQIQNLKCMSFAPSQGGGNNNEDYKSEVMGANGDGMGAQMPQTFTNKYQPQLDGMKGGSYRKRAEMEEPGLGQEPTHTDQDLSVMRNQQLQKEQKKQFSVFAISGYCDQPLQAVEKITFKLNAKVKDIGGIQQQTFAERVSSNYRQEDEESVCGGAPGWQQCAQLNVARTKFVSVVVPENRQAGRIKQQVWILGGKNAQSQRIDVIEMYDESTDAWNIIPQIKMRKAKSGFASVLVHNEAKQVDQLMVIGGNDGQVQNRVEFMNLWDYQWHKCASMISRRDELAACLGPDGKIYAIGGYGGPTNSSCLRSVERYDVVKNKWEQVAPMNEGRRALAAVSMPDGIYAIGGYNGKDYISSVEKYDIETDTWSVVCHLNSPKCTMTAVASPDAQSFFVIGGFNGTQLNEVEVYNTQTRLLRKFTFPMQMKRFMHSSAVLIQ